MNSIQTPERPPEPTAPAATARPPKLRKDAVRNRERVLRAAAKLVSEQGIGVSYDEIARLAGVGVGTVYRRFPRRDELVSALFKEHMGHLHTILSSALEIEDPWQALCTYCRILTDEWIADRGLPHLLLGSAYSDFPHYPQTDLSAQTATLLQRAQKAGAVRPELSPDDVKIMIYMVCRLGVEDGDLAARYLALALDAMRSGAPPLPGPQPNEATFANILARI